MGFVGPTTTIQWKRAGEQVRLHEVWRSPCRDTLSVLEVLVDEGVCGFNITHDWFHVQRLYCILRLLDPGAPPTPKGWLGVQREAVRGPCLKPAPSLDLMLHAMQGPAQSLMGRNDVRVKRVPRALAQALCRELKSRIDLPGIYFHYREGGYQWTLDDHQGTQEDFPDVVLRWGASRGLKPLGRHLLGVDVMDFPVERQFMPEEDTWNPFGDGWFRHFDYHVAFWAKSERARKYAVDDVEVLTYGLWKHFGSPPGGDTNSTLACQVGASRWRGYSLDLGLLEQIREDADRRMHLSPRAPKTVLGDLRDLCSPVEALAIQDTSAETLHEVGGNREGGEWTGGWGNGAHPAAQYARRAIVARSAEKERDLCGKLLTVRSFHPDAKVIGALSGRMSGSGGINVQGIPGAQKGSRVRHAFLLADEQQWLGADMEEMLLADRGEELDAGDFESFEVAIAAAVYKDQGLTDALRSGKKIHAIYGSVMLELSYDVVRKDKRLYNDSKRAFLGRLYGAQDPKVASVLGIPLDQVERNEAKLAGQFPGIGEARQRVADRFCSMRQPGGIGTRVEWHEPADYCESLFGFKRYFTLENRICFALFELANRPPEGLRSRTSVQRTQARFQTAGGATQSALYACAFNMQASAMRQAANHEIQSSGAWITKELQAEIWKHQPTGIAPWMVRPINVHDEIQCPRDPRVDLRPTVQGLIERFRSTVPLLSMEWMRGLRSWAEKG